MPFAFKYTPVLRSRQQELQVLSSFNFEDRIFPLLEVIKEKDRVNNARASQEIWLDYVQRTQATKVLVDLPVYIRDSGSMSDEVLAFNRTVISNVDRRIEFFTSLAPQAQKIIPVISTLLFKTGEINTLTTQVNALRPIYPNLAIRTFTNTLDRDVAEIRALLTANDILIYDLDTILPMNPLVTLQRGVLGTINLPYKIVVRSAINNDIMNVRLDHGEIIADADNSLQQLFRTNLGMSAFGDYAGIKKDDLNAGGTISPGFIFFDPLDNLYYGYKGAVKDLAEFKATIVPAVLSSRVVARIRGERPEFLNQENIGFAMLNQIRDNAADSGKSQAKFKRIAMEHYLHCMRVMIRANAFG